MTKRELISIFSLKGIEGKNEPPRVMVKQKKRPVGKGSERRERLATEIEIFKRHFLAS